MHKLFASKITNLTDARYFAAYMPTFMSMPLPAEKGGVLNDFRTIMSWIDGVHWLIELQQGQEINPLMLENLEMKGIHYRGLASYQPEKSLKGTKVISVQPDEVSEVVSDPGLLTDFHEIVLPGSTSISSIQTISNSLDTRLWLHINDIDQWDLFHPVQNRISGIVVEGGAEEKVGLKSFDQVDEILDKVMF